MSKLLKIGIIGCGAIGSSLAEAIVKELSGKATLVALYDRDAEKAKKLSLRVSKNKSRTVRNCAQLIRKSNLVIESAQVSSAWDIARCALVNGRDIMIMSVGGIIDRIQQLSHLARRHNSRVYIPSGAISGIDALKAAKIGKIKKVTLTTRKNPESFKGVKFVEDKKIQLHTIKKDMVLFSGPARRAVKYFPQNINVAAVLSIAGIGQDKTYVKIIASPSAKKNIHEIQIESHAGKIFTRTENNVHPDNPKTSYLAVLAARATLKQILEPVRIGT